MATTSSPILTETARATDDAPSPLSEAWRVCTWRLAQLSDAGYNDDSAAVLAASPGVDLHRAADLLQRGCPQLTALDILL